MQKEKEFNTREILKFILDFEGLSHLRTGSSDSDEAICKECTSRGVGWKSGTRCRSTERETEREEDGEN